MPSSTTAEPSLAGEAGPPTPDGNTYPFSAEGICRIIDACGRNEVVEAHLGDFSLFRSLTEQRLYGSRKPARKNVPGNVGGLPAKPVVGERIPNQPLVDGPTNEIEQESLDVEAEKAREDYEINLPLNDPVAWDQHQLRLLEAAGRGGIPANIESDLDDEDLPQ